MVEVLLDHNPTLELKNKRNKKASDVACNPKIEQLISNRGKSSKNPTASNVKLFKAVTVGDPSLFDQIFGIKVVDGVPEEDDQTDQRHQFCTCVNCE